MVLVLDRSLLVVVADDTALLLVILLLLRVLDDVVADVPTGSRTTTACWSSFLSVLLVALFAVALLEVDVAFC